MEITSLSNKIVVYAAQLKEKKYRDKENKYLIEGEHLISMAKDVECIFTTNKNYINDKVMVYYVTDAILKKISAVEAPQNIIAIVKKEKYELDYTKNRYLICDGVSDPGNMGTIIRTALAFNVDMIILSNGSVDIYNDKVIRGSQGAILKIPFVYGNVNEIIKKLKEHNVCVIASTLSSRSVPLNSLKDINKFALIVGNEGSGVSLINQQDSDINVKIEHSNNIDSLNVGVATSLMLYYLDSISKGE